MLWKTLPNKAGEFSSKWITHFILFFKEIDFDVLLSFRVFLYEKYLNSGDLTFFVVINNKFLILKQMIHWWIKKNNVDAMLCILANIPKLNQLTQTSYVRQQRATQKREGSEKWEKEKFAVIYLFVTPVRDIKKRNHQFTNLKSHITFE